MYCFMFSALLPIPQGQAQLHEVKTDCHATPSTHPLCHHPLLLDVPHHE